MTKEISCPNCKSVLNSHKSETSDVPKKDDISVCLYCQSVLMFNEDLTLRAISKDEWDKLPNMVKMEVIVERTLCQLMASDDNTSTTIH